MKKGILIIIVLVLIATVGCYNDKYDQLYVTSPNTVCDTTSVSFATVIQPILNTNCIVCHSSSGVASSYGDFTAYGRSLTAQVNNGDLLRDINITSLSSVNHMPQNAASLSSCEIAQITAWVNQGALDN